VKTAGRNSARRKRRGSADTAVKNRAMLDVLRQFRVVFRSARQHYGLVERQTGVSGVQLWALAHVADHPGCKVSDLARALAVHPSTASNLVARLEQLALLMRRRVGTDQRTVQLYPSAKGSNAVRRAPRPMVGVLQQALCELPEQTLLSLRGSLTRLLDEMKAKGGRAAPISKQ